MATASEAAPADGFLVDSKLSLIDGQGTSARDGRTPESADPRGRDATRVQPRSA
jgi:hypothetical protein